MDVIAKVLELARNSTGSRREIAKALGVDNTTVNKWYEERTDEETEAGKRRLMRADLFIKLLALVGGDISRALPDYVPEPAAPELDRLRRDNDLADSDSGAEALRAAMPGAIANRITKRGGKSAK